MCACSPQTGAAALRADRDRFKTEGDAARVAAEALQVRAEALPTAARVACRATGAAAGRRC
jgi:hypothetical protein